MCTSSRRGAQRGVSLLELILAIVVIGISLAAVLTVYSVAAQHSADPMVRQQAQLVAEAYLEEVLLKKFYDPDTSTVCPAAEGARANYDNVCDYNGINQAPTDQFGNAIATLAGYNVQVTVTTNNTVNLNGLTNGPAADEIRVLRVDITVTGPDNAIATLSGYRTNYECNASGDAGCKAL